jgi:hypothetical protein
VRLEAGGRRLEAHQPSVSLEGSPSSAPAKKSVIALTSLQKAGVLTLLLGLIWVRMLRRRKAAHKECPHCGHKNAPHLTNCTKCQAPLFGS